MSKRKNSDFWRGLWLFLGGILFLAAGTAIGMIKSFKDLAESGSPETGVSIAKVSGYIFYPFLIVGIFLIVKGILLRKRSSEK